MKQDIRWPKKGDDPFLVKHSKPTSSTWASLSWLARLRFDDSQLASAFKECGDKIINDLQSQEIHKHADIYFIPIAYLYRHALELKMKEIIRLGLHLDLLQDNKSLRKSLEEHSLYPLWNHVKKSATNSWPSSPKHELVAVERIIQALHEIDKSGQNLRYTKDTNGKSTLSYLPDSVDLVHFKEILDGVFNLLNGCEDAFIDALETKRQMEQDYQP